MTEALTDVRQISKLAYGFMASKALFAALHVELFRHLSQGADTLSALSAATGVRPQPLATLLATLRSVGLITADSGKYSNAPAADRYLVPNRPAYFGDYYRHQIDRQLAEICHDCALQPVGWGESPCEKRHASVRLEGKIGANWPTGNNKTVKSIQKGHSFADFLPVSAFSPRRDLSNAWASAAVM